MIHVDKVQAMAPVFTSTFILLISRSELTVAPDTSYHLWESSCTNNDISDTDTVDLHPNNIEKDELSVDWEDLWSGTRKLLHDICKNAKFVWDLLLDPGTDLGLSTGLWWSGAWAWDHLAESRWRQAGDDPQQWGRADNSTTAVLSPHRPGIVRGRYHAYQSHQHILVNSFHPRLKVTGLRSWLGYTLWKV